MKALPMAIMLSLGLSACMKAQPQPQSEEPKAVTGEEDVIKAALSIAELVFEYDYDFPDSASCGAKGSTVMEFRGDDMKHRIFASLLEQSKTSSPDSAACAKPKEEYIRLNATLTNGEKIVFVPENNCKRSDFPEGSRFVPEKLLRDVQVAFAFWWKKGAFKINQIGIYSGDVRIWEADYASFEIMEGYGRDKARVYMGSKAIEGADRDSFEALGNMWARDKQNFYYEDKVVSDVDRSTFAVMNGYNYAIDSQNVYYAGMKKADIDPATFALVPGSLYAVDAQSVYQFGEVMPGLSPVNFACEGSVCRNDSQVLAFGILMPGVDPATFVVDRCVAVYPSSVYSLCSAPRPPPEKYICNAHDKNGTYTFDRPDL